MSAGRTCDQCGALLASDAPDGLCPNCRDDADARTVREEQKTEPIFTEPHAERIGHYKLLQKIGEGGCGVVYMADQEEPVKRRVALKVIKLGMDTRQVVARFEAERQALALMDHPNIAKVFDGGATDAGRPYFVMELVKGVKITEYCDQNHVGLKERLDLFLQVCQAIQHAHQKGIIHRDIKPSNIMVAMHDGKPVPKVIDFGIAKATEQRLTDKTLFTYFEQFMGTPVYMSPEQAESTGLDIDTRSDIYSLGVLLYELLTGRPPFENETLLKKGIEEARRAIREVEAPRPSTKLSTLGEPEMRVVAKHRSAEPPKLLSSVRGDLDWIVMKCLEKDRTRRYDTANGLAMDIGRYLSQEPIVARPPSNVYRIQKLIRRNKAAVAAAALIVGALVVGLGAATWALIRERAARVEAKTSLYAADMNLAELAREQQDIGLAVKLLNAHRPAPGERDLRGWEWRYLWRRCQSDELLTLGRHDNVVYSVAFSPDGRVLASSSTDGTFKLWDLKSRHVIGGGMNSTRLGSVDCPMAFSPDGHLLATAGSDNAVKLWEWKSNRQVGALQAEGNISSIAISADSQMLAAAVQGSSDEVTVWEIETRRKLTSSRISNARHVAFSHTGATLAIGTDNGPQPGQILLWDVTTAKPQAAIAAYAEAVNSLAFSPDGKTLASGGKDSKTDGSVKLWDIMTFQLIGRGAIHTEEIPGVVFSPDGSMLASASSDRTIKLWDPAAKKEIALLRGHLQEVRSVAFAPDNQTLASGSKDGEVKLWPAAPKSEENNFRAIPSDTDRWFLSLGAKTITLSSTNGTLSIREASTLREITTFPAPVTNLESFATSPDGRLMATGARDGTMRLWRIDGSRLIQVAEFLTQTGAVSALAFSLDSRTLAYAARSEVKLWSLEPLRQVGNLATHPSRIRGLAFSPDGSTLAVNHTDSKVEVWDATAAKRLALFEGHKDLVWSVALSRHGDILATASLDATAKLWSVKAQREIATFEGQMYALMSAALSSDDQRLVVGGSDGTIKIWDIASKRPLLTIKGHKRAVRAVQFVADGNTLVSASRDSVAVWRAADLAEIDANTK